MKLSIEQRAAVGRAIVRIRTEQNLTQEKLEAKSGVPLRTIQRAERGDGIGSENLDSLALALGATAAEILRQATPDSAQSPDLRLCFKVVDSGAGLIKELKRVTGNLQVGPEGEHVINEQIGMMLLNLGDVQKEDSGISRSRALEEAEYLIRYCAELGFQLFACNYKEVEIEKNKAARYPTTIILAAQYSDPRIRRTAKGTVLDFVMDRRKQIVQGIMKRKLTAYDWMEEQMLSRSDGEVRVRYAIQRIHDDVRKGLERKGARRP